MSPPLHTSVRKGLPAGQPSTALDVGKFIEGGSDAPESGLAHPPEIRLRRPGRAPLDEAADARLPGPIRRASGHERSPSSAGLSETLALLLAYDGAAFRGWQKQPGMQTVQGTLEDALRLLLGKRPIVHGASRTDAGVHASGQVASFRSGRAPDLDRLQLPEAIRLLRWERACPSFHARSSSIGKRYRYDLRRFVAGAADWGRARAALEGLRGLPHLSGLCSPAKEHRPAP